MPLESLVRTALGMKVAVWRSQGPGPPVVCVHGAGVSSRELLPFVREMGVTHDAWSLDLPGFGRSEKPRAPLTVTGLADAVADWLAASELRRPCLLGGSFGCQVAVDLAVRHPGAAGALVLVGPTVDARARSAVRLVGQWLRNSVRESPRMMPLNVADYLDAGPRRVLASFGASMRDRIEDKLPHVTVPVLVVRGGADRMVSQAWAEEVTRLLPRGRLVVMEGLPHMVPYRDPRGLAREVAAFLERAW
ncbi:alpha/beta fold hydrolase [Nonomuraea gerenzanensis]|uniref:Hydrolase, alpha/beta hydrolase fold family n=1 Tax=Nonomuraea gerenzanensis TaxID=93944 RepID=A0A1M4EBY2_9ACTN|nr:alpha/beta hydrolase [Nonomuraea gerenzanensis]UBU18614.1 alpha/beta hydrolase [Nonomuraea gerenzanensis]SBO96461.1 Hydrolase, alpha/beta hydrolase fold family [Nonomuraea gerenzanensis]